MRYVGFILFSFDIFLQSRPSSRIFRSFWTAKRRNWNFWLAKKEVWWVATCVDRRPTRTSKCHLTFLFLLSNQIVWCRSQEEFEKADAFVLVYSVVDKASYTRIEQLLMQLQDADLIRSRPVIIVANKIDLARSRAVSSQGKHPSVRWWVVGRDQR